MRPSTYVFDGLLDGVGAENGRHTIHLKGLRVSLSVPLPRIPSGGANRVELGLRTDIDIPAETLVVIGKAGVKGPIRGAFIILKAKLME